MTKELEQVRQESEGLQEMSEQVPKNPRVRKKENERMRKVLFVQDTKRACAGTTSQILHQFSHAKPIIQVSCTRKILA